jgi:hypothetical protein
MTKFQVIAEETKERNFVKMEKQVKNLVCTSETNKNKKKVACC